MEFSGFLAENILSLSANLKIIVLFIFQEFQIPFFVSKDIPNEYGHFLLFFIIITCIGFEWAIRVGGIFEYFFKTCKYIGLIHECGPMWFKSRYCLTTYVQHYSLSQFTFKTLYECKWMSIIEIVSCMWSDVMTQIILLFDHIVPSAEVAITILRSA